MSKGTIVYTDILIRVLYSHTPLSSQFSGTSIVLPDDGLGICRSRYGSIHVVDQIVLIDKGMLTIELLSDCLHCFDLGLAAPRL